MSKEKDQHTEEQQNDPRPWRVWRPPRRQTRWRVLWALGMVIALMALALLVSDLLGYIYLGLGEGPARGRTERLATLVAIGVAVTAIIVLLVLGGASLGWTGFAEKTLWEWLQLLSTLAIPLAVVAATAWFSSQQSTTQTQIEEQRAQDVALQAYLDQMSTLMLDEDLRTTENTEVRTLARARTVTVLRRLDPSHKREVIGFLVSAELVQRVDGSDPIVPLNDADLTETKLAGVPLKGAELTGAHFRDADLTNADLRDANLYFADLPGAELDYAKLVDANLDHANFTDANLTHAKLCNAHMFFTLLGGADLTNALLTGAKDISPEDLQDAKSLKGATMPNGQKYENWLKDRERGRRGGWGESTEASKADCPVGDIF